jgi:hypothetical protein
MGSAFWIRRGLTVLVAAFVVICVAQLLKGHSWSYAAGQGAAWGVISAAVFTTARFFQARRGQHCAVCKDTPETQQSPNASSS